MDICPIFISESLLYQFFSLSICGQMLRFRQPSTLADWAQSIDCLSNLFVKIEHLCIVLKCGLTFQLESTILFSLSALSFY